MRPLQYVRPVDVDDAVQAIATISGARFLGGGTNLVDLIRSGVEQPEVVIDLTRLPLTGIDEIGGGGLRIGAGTSNADVAAHPFVREHFPVLAQAIVAGASGQIRNMASVGGNLLQRTRCLYFFDTASACNKRELGSGCSAVGGFNRMGAILGASDSCVAVHPSDLAVALAILEAEVEVISRRGSRMIPFGDFHRLPGDTPHIDTDLAADELVVAVHIPRSGLATTSRYRKVRDRTSYAFALVSVAAAMQVTDGAVRRARVALGGVAHKPWRATVLEERLAGGPATDEAFGAAIDAELESAVSGPETAFKIGLTRRTVVAVLRTLREKGGAA